jgi:hypothetical protein
MMSAIGQEPGPGTGAQQRRAGQRTADVRVSAALGWRWPGRRACTGKQRQAGEHAIGRGGPSTLTDQLTDGLIFGQGVVAALDQPLGLDLNRGWRLGWRPRRRCRP